MGHLEVADNFDNFLFQVFFPPLPSLPLSFSLSLSSSCCLLFPLSHLLLFLCLPSICFSLLFSVPFLSLWIYLLITKSHNSIAMNTQNGLSKLLYPHKRCWIAFLLSVQSRNWNKWAHLEHCHDFGFCLVICSPMEEESRLVWVEGCTQAPQFEVKLVPLYRWEKGEAQIPGAKVLSGLGCWEPWLKGSFHYWAVVKRHLCNRKVSSRSFPQ